MLEAHVLTARQVEQPPAACDPVGSADVDEGRVPVRQGSDIGATTSGSWRREVRTSASSKPRRCGLSSRPTRSPSIRAKRGGRDKRSTARWIDRGEVEGQRHDAAGHAHARDQGAEARSVSRWAVIKFLREGTGRLDAAVRGHPARWSDELDPPMSLADSGAASRRSGDREHRRSRRTSRKKWWRLADDWLATWQTS